MLLFHAIELIAIKLGTKISGDYIWSEIIMKITLVKPYSPTIFFLNIFKHTRSSVPKVNKLKRMF